MVIKPTWGAFGFVLIGCADFEIESESESETSQSKAMLQ